MKKKRRIGRIIRRITYLLLYFACIGVLIYEAQLDAKSSANKSNNVGGNIADIINGAEGDQSKKVLPADVIINNEITSFKTGEFVQLTHTTKPDNASYVSYTYASSNTDVALVNEAGLVTFIGAGEATITVTNKDYTNVKDTITFTISDILVNEISSVINGLELNKNNIYELQVDSSYNIVSNVNNDATDKSVSYSVLDNEYITISDEGKITAKKVTDTPIEITIISSNNEVFTTISVIVKPIPVPYYPVTNIETDSNSYNIYVGDTITPKISILPIDATNKQYTIETANTDIISINGNEVTGLKAGTAIVTIKASDNIVKDIEIKVNNILVSNIETDKNEYNMYTGESVTPIINVTPNNAFDMGYTISSNSDCISINNGIITGVKEGTAKVTITSNDGNAYKEIIINVIDYIYVNNFEVEEQYEINVGESVTPTINPLPSNAMNKEFIIATTNTDIVSIDGNTISGIKAGTATIKIISADGNCIKEFNVIVKHVSVESIETDKNEYTVGVNKTITPKITVSPSDATNSKYTMTSDSDCISITNGVIKGTKAGTATVTVTSDEDNTIIKTFTVTVKYIDVTGITSNKSSYTINVGKIVTPKITISPSNASNNKYTMSITSGSEYISIKNGKITGKAAGTATVTVTSQDKPEIYKTFTVIVKYISVTDISNSENEYNIFATESITLDITVTPSNATNKKYTITTENTDIVSINGTKVTGIKEGTAIIKITSLADENIYTEVKVNVSIRPEYETYAINNYPTEMIIADELKLELSTYPIDAIVDISYTSSNNEILTVDNAGNIKAISAGTAYITLNINGNEYKLADIKVKVKSEIIDYNVKISNDLVYVNDVIDLDQFISYEWITNDGSSLLPTEVPTYSIDTNIATLDNNTLTINDAGVITITINHSIYGNKEITLYSIGDFDVSIDGNIISNNNSRSNNIIDIKLYTIIPLSINQNNSNQKYELSIDNDNVSIINYEDLSYGLKGLLPGNSILTITPYLPNCDYDLSQFSVTINLSVSHVLTTDFSSNINITHFDKSNDEATLDNIIELYVNDSAILEVEALNNPTIYAITYKSSNNKIFTVSNIGEIKPVAAGSATLTIIEENSNIVKEYNVIIKNYIEINKEKPVTITGNTLKLNKNTNVYNITNGNAGKIKVNFTDNSTYKNVTYTSSNTKVLTVGKDGTITTLKAGTAKVIVTCDDGSLDEPITYEINIKVNAVPAISNLKQFLYNSRKLIGHFGAYLVLGIFSTLTFVFYFTKKHWLWSIPLNFAQGFGLAALTEYIQTFVPGRAGVFSDVMINFSGFLTSSIFITFLILFVHFIIFIVKKIKMKKQEQTVEIL